MLQTKATLVIALPPLILINNIIIDSDKLTCAADVHAHLQPTDAGDLDTASTISSRYLVEFSAITASGHDAIGSEMKAFAEQLKPYPK